MHNPTNDNLNDTLPAVMSHLEAMAIALSVQAVQDGGSPRAWGTAFDMYAGAVHILTALGVKGLMDPTSDQQDVLIAFNALRNPDPMYNNMRTAIFWTLRADNDA